MNSEFKIQNSEFILHSLTNGRMESLGLLPWGSNYTFLAEITPPGAPSAQTEADDDDKILAVYKPRRGETPLWDFPDGTLCLREFAAYAVSEALGWRLVPPTVLRSGAHGFGSVQLFIENDPNQHFFTFKADPALAEPLMRLALFDLITNNADRKSGHCLLDKNGQLWAIDHGICFNADYKLRTVIWDFGGQSVPAPMLADLRHLLAQLPSGQTLGKALRQVLDGAEMAAFEKRISGLIKIGTFPMPGRNERNIPWPPV